MVTKYTGSDKVVKIPESYKNYKVTVIGPSVFNDSKSLRLQSRQASNRLKIMLLQTATVLQR